MKLAIEDGGPAFPCDMTRDHTGKFSNGMSLRDYLAGQALVGLLTILAHPKQMESALVQYSDAGECMRKMREATAQGAYMIADAMLAERDKGKI